MAKEIIMPKLSDTMTEGLFAGWHKKVGDRIERGDIIAEVETDKAVMELEAFASGVLLQALAKEGETVPVGTVLGLIGEPEEIGTVATPSAEVTPAIPAEHPAISKPPVLIPPPAALKSGLIQSEAEYQKASPLVRRLAREHGVDLKQLHGSGPEGRITQDDLAAFIQQHASQTSTSPLPSSHGDGAPAHPQQPAAAEFQSSMRQAIATAVTQSWQNIPHFSVTMEIDMDACREVIGELKTEGRPIGYTSLLIKACAIVLKKFPLLRAQDARLADEININIAVALPDGLLMPVLRNCAARPVLAVEQELTKLVEKCHAGKLSSEEMNAGCFSLSNLGMYGVDEFTALIMPGQTAILAVGSVMERPFVRNGSLAVAATLRVTLSSDHRTVDGAYAAQFLAELRRCLETPAILLADES